MKKRQELLTDEHRELIEPLLPKPTGRPDSVGFRRPLRLGGFYRTSFLRLHLLAAATAMARGRGVAGCVACAVEIAG